MNTKPATIEKYPVIWPKRMSASASAGQIYITVFALIALFWLIYSAVGNFLFPYQIIALVIVGIFNLFKNALAADAYLRAKLDLKAKGLDIKDRFFNAVMPWDWLEKVEMRQRSFSIFPNYVYFRFRDKSDVIILWDDVKDTMDSTMLISCVRTWAPHAEIVGDATLTKSESIATYTELWLKDMSSVRSEGRLRQDQILEKGTVLSKSYKIDRVLSGGGQGTAYLAKVLPGAEVPDVPPHVVIKEFILPANDRGLKKATDALVKEVAILRRIRHPKIVRLYDFFIEDMRGYLVIEFIDGVTLRQLVDKYGPLAEKRVAEVTVSLCEALSYLHELDPPIIHGDVTPDNIMLENSGGIKVMDFDASQELTRNKTNTVVGKHAYMSSEQFKGEISDSSDIYALGCTMQFLLTGNDPEPISVSHPAAHNSAVSKRMDDIVSKATAFDASSRYSNLNEMRAQLEQF